MPSSQTLALEHLDSAPSFTRWALEALRCEVTPAGDSVWQATLPESLRDNWQGRATLRFAASNGRRAAGIGDGEVLAADASSELFRWAVEQLQASGPVVHAEPVAGPRSVHEITPRLFSAFEFPQGHIHLAGCSLEDRPILRLTVAPAEDEPADRLRHYYFWPEDGSEVAADLVAALQLGEVRPCRPPAAKPPEATIRRWVASAHANFGDRSAELFAATLIWCKYAHGKLALGVADERVEDVEIPFAAWAAQLADGSVKPPAYRCPHSGLASYRLAITDDGRIVAAEAIAECDQSGRRVLASEIEQCAATGKCVCSDLLQTCRASGQRVLASEIVRCAQCDQPVSPNVLQGGRCSACRALAPVRKDDPRMARLLDVYPKLDRWSRWRISETDSTYVLVATGWLRQLLLVVDKDSLEVAHAATAGRFLSAWQELPSGEREELLG